MLDLVSYRDIATVWVLSVVWSSMVFPLQDTCK
jgi:hypothetical protein